MKDLKIIKKARANLREPKRTQPKILNQRKCVKVWHSQIICDPYCFPFHWCTISSCQHCQKCNTKWHTYFQCNNGVCIAKTSVLSSKYFLIGQKLVITSVIKPPSINFLSLQSSPTSNKSDTSLFLKIPFLVYSVVLLLRQVRLNSLTFLEYACS